MISFIRGCEELCSSLENEAKHHLLRHINSVYMIMQVATENSYNMRATLFNLPLRVRTVPSLTRKNVISSSLTHSTKRVR